MNLIELLRIARRGAGAATMAIALVPAAQAATVVLGDIVANPSAVNDFEAAPAGLIGNTWAQQGVRVTQINGDPPNSIWSSSAVGNGQRSWYPNAGDDGWTRITLDSGENFEAVSFFGGVGQLLDLQDAPTLYFELLDDGAPVLSGSLGIAFFGGLVSFFGGDFDEIRVRGREGQLNALDGCPHLDLLPRCNYFWVDDIKVGRAEIPEPASLALVLLALGLLAGRGHRHSRV